MIHRWILKQGLVAVVGFYDELGIQGVCVVVEIPFLVADQLLRWPIEQLIPIKYPFYEHFLNAFHF